jgi:hypothetical protein
MNLLQRWINRAGLMIEAARLEVEVAARDKAFEDRAPSTSDLVAYGASKARLVQIREELA